MFDALWARDQIRIYASEAERTQALARLAADAFLAGNDGVLLMADTREQTTALNGAIRDRLVATGHVDDISAVVTHAGERLGIGDRVATRHNDRELGVANRDTWTITGITDDGALTLQGKHGARVVPAAYARGNVDLAYATTVYGAEGETTREGHLLLGEHTTASSAYVGMTRGRETNVAHLVATDIDDARRQWDEVFSRDRADLGPAHAARRAAEDVERYAPHRPFDVALAELWAAWTKEDQLQGAFRRATQRRNVVAHHGPETAERVAEIDAELAEYRGLLDAASDQVRVRLREPAIRSLPPGRLEQERSDWLQQRAQARRAATEQRRRAAERRHELDAGYRRTPDTGRGIGR